MLLQTFIFYLTISTNVLTGEGGIIRSSDINNDNVTLCETVNCKKAAKFILEGLNTNVDPCEDFYQYACGRWRSTNPLPPGKQLWSRLTVAEQQVEKRLIDILENKNEFNGSKLITVMTEYYQDCMDLEALERTGLEPIDTIIKNFGDWPLLTQDSTTEISWQELDKRYMKILGSFSLFDVKVVSDRVQGGTSRMKVVSPEFPRSDAFPLNTRWPEFWRYNTKYPYRRFITEVVEILFKHRNPSNAKKPWWEDHYDYSFAYGNYGEELLYEDTLTADTIEGTNEMFYKDIVDMLEFEYKLHEAHKAAEDALKGPYAIEELQKHYNNLVPLIHNKAADINWMELMTDLLVAVNFTVERTEEIFMFDRQFITRLAQLLNSTKNRTIVNYIHWKFIATMIPFTNEHTRKLLFDVYGIDHIKHRLTRQEECLIECRLHHVLFHEYAKQHFPEKVKADLLEMSEEIKNEILYSISKTEWLDEGTQLILFDKVDNIHFMVGYPAWYTDEKITDYYKDLELGSTYFEKILNYEKFTQLVNLREFRQPMPKYEFLINPTSVSAAYAYYYNAVMIPMASVQWSQFSGDLPRAFKYGLDGFTIAHEIFHALDPHGVSYDKRHQKFKWPKSTLKKYKEQVQCVTDQFDNVLLVDVDPKTELPVWIEVNGTLAEKENTADVAAVQTAFQVYYQGHFSENDVRLPGLEDYNGDQLFFISYANRWCQIASHEWWQSTYGERDYDEGHSPVQLRVNKPLQNFEEFANAFNCRNTSLLVSLYVAENHNDDEILPT